VGLKENVAARLRSSRAAWTAYNLLHYREPKRNSDHYKRLGIRRSVVAPIAHRDISKHVGEPAWLDRPDAKRTLRDNPEFQSFDPATQAELERWVDEGFLILEGQLSSEQVDEVNAEIQRLFDEGIVKYHPLSPRVMNAFEHSPAIDAGVEDPELLRLLSFVLGRQAVLFQTINFFSGSQQAAHSDSFHMTTEPPGYLAAIWVALEDVEPGSGPLFYYPGSHRFPYVMTEDLGERRPDEHSKEDSYSRRIGELIAERGIEPVEFYARKGDLLIWHANLLHGGRGIEREGSTRKSLVAHYFGDGVLCYHESTERPALVRSP
jgi:Phytanoyl-CoA dioxygenase (PhyH)